MTAEELAEINVRHESRLAVNPPRIQDQLALGAVMGFYIKAENDCAALLTHTDAQAQRIAELTHAMAKINDKITQVLGKALKYPWFKDDQNNFPGATEENGVCVGDHVAESLADEAAKRIAELEAQLAARGPSPVEAEIIRIMAEYDRQYERNKGYVDTPGGLEHMGDVWQLLGGWRDAILSSGALATAQAVTLTEEERETIERAKQRWNPESEVGELYTIIDRLTGASTP